MAEFKEFERRFKFKPRLKYGWFHLKCFKIQVGAKFKPGFADLNRGSNSSNSISGKVNAKIGRATITMSGLFSTEAF